jgi:hypothetical protein
MDAAKNVSATFNPATTPPPPDTTLTVSKLGTGSGTVASRDNRITCGSTCSATYAPGTSVTLAASAAPGSSFGGWGGDAASCGTNTTCTLTMDKNKNVSATFDVIILTVTVTKQGTASGLVLSRDGKIDCGTVCSATYAPGSSLVLAETFGTNSSFAGWGGDAASCGLANTCTLTVNSSLNVVATFNAGIGVARQPLQSWTSELAVAGASAHVLVNGEEVVLATSGRSEHTLRALPEENRIEARLVRRAGSGTWRFAFEAGTIEPGSLRVEQGDALLVTPDAVVFRLSGRANEVVAFSFRAKTRE